MVDLEPGVYFHTSFKSKDLIGVIELLSVNDDGTIDTSLHKRHMPVGTFTKNHWKDRKYAEKIATQRFCEQFKFTKNNELYEDQMKFITENYPEYLLTIKHEEKDAEWLV